VHANHVRAYAKAAGIAAKTDKIDAKILAEFAIRMEIKAKSETQQYEALKALLTRREQLIGMRLQERNRLETCVKLVGNWIEQNIEQLTKQIEQIEKALDSEVGQDDGLKKLYQLYNSIPGIGKITSLQLIVDLPELLIER
jgi:transposase